MTCATDKRQEHSAFEHTILRIQCNGTHLRFLLLVIRRQLRKRVLFPGPGPPNILPVVDVQLLQLLVFRLQRHLPGLFHFDAILLQFPRVQILGLLILKPKNVVFTIILSMTTGTLFLSGFFWEVLTSNEWTVPIRTNRRWLPTKTGCQT